MALPRPREAPVISATFFSSLRVLFVIAPSTPHPTASPRLSCKMSHRLPETTHPSRSLEEWPIVARLPRPQTPPERPPPLSLASSPAERRHFLTWEYPSHQGKCYSPGLQKGLN